MKKLLFLFSFLVCLNTYSQESKDTTFSVREFACSCKYSNNIDDKNKIFDRSEEAAYYPGRDKEWKKFLKKNLNTDYAGKKHEFRVQFVVNKDGDLSDFRLLDRAVNQKYEEAVRVLKQSGKWFPAIQNEYCVTAYYRVLFEF